MKKWLVILATLALGYYLFSHREKPAAPPETTTAVKRAAPIAKPAPPPVPLAPPQPMVITPPRPVQPTTETKKPLIMPYVVEGDLAIVQGDVVVGTLTNKDAPERGQVVVPAMNLWPTNVIPYHIQPTVTNPDRIKAALEMFASTNVQFVPYTNQTDALVFEESTGVCKSYVGHVGGLQPVFLPPDCGPHEVAHEIMHALGFVHEQNRADRDQYIEVDFANIDDAYTGNFEKLPPEFMQASGLANFDFESIMIYPTSMFAKGSRPTMQPLDHSKQIQPSYGLSKLDVERVNQAYNR